MVDNSSIKCTRGVKNYSRDTELVGELQGPSQEEIGDEGNGRRRVRLEPVDNRILEFRQGVDDGVVSFVADFSDVLYTRGQFGVRREGENKCLNGGWVGGEQRIEDGEIFGGDDDGDG
ncbi:hypothetical protein L6164_026983 [Bauhinia variegata]|uniref:Uncharacterized protein n=1 Tax=Bauhinia variegata TaxID=167791 RepID=A0ACB9LRT8_BAUVA|nr:hypothetical protein L6164_026983 [Bauhinia variegata]